ncbi:MAG: AAA family ATPase, partial [Acidimicrobiia bacterium]
MLDELVVRNLGVIKEAAIYPGPRLTVVTGETGAGKTLLVGALRMLLGADGGADLVGPFGEEGSAEGRFLIAGREIAAVRRLFRQGRSRAYLDGSIASNKALTDELSESIDIIGQQDHLSLTRAVVVRNLVDANFDSKGRGFLDEYGRMRPHWQDL